MSDITSRFWRSPRLVDRQQKQLPYTLDTLSETLARFEEWIELEKDHKERFGGLYTLLDALRIRSEDERYELEPSASALFAPRDLKPDPARALHNKETYCISWMPWFRFLIFDVDGAKTVQDIKEQGLPFRDLPLLSPRGTFIIDGQEVLLPPRLMLPSGVYFSRQDKNVTVHLVTARSKQDQASAAGVAEIEITQHPSGRLSCRFLSESKLPASYFGKNITKQSDLPKSFKDGFALLDWFEQHSPSFPISPQFFLRRLNHLEGGFSRGIIEILLTEEGPKLLLASASRSLTTDVDIKDATGNIIVPAGKPLTGKALKGLREAGIYTIPLPMSQLSAFRVMEDVFSKETGELFFPRGAPLQKEHLQSLRRGEPQTIKAWYPNRNLYHNGEEPDELQEEDVWIESRAASLHRADSDLIEDLYRALEKRTYPSPQPSFSSLLRMSLVLLEGLSQTKGLFLPKPPLAGMFFCDATEQLSQMIWRLLLPLRGTSQRRLEKEIQQQNVPSLLPDDLIHRRERSAFSEKLFQELRQRVLPFDCKNPLALNCALRTISLSKDQRFTHKDQGRLIDRSPDAASLSVYSQLSYDSWIEAPYLWTHWYSADDPVEPPSLLAWREMPEEKCISYASLLFFQERVRPSPEFQRYEEGEITAEELARVFSIPIYGAGPETMGAEFNRSEASLVQRLPLEEALVPGLLANQSIVKEALCLLSPEEPWLRTGFEEKIHGRPMLYGRHLRVAFTRDGPVIADERLYQNQAWAFTQKFFLSEEADPSLLQAGQILSTRSGIRFCIERFSPSDEMPFTPEGEHAELVLPLPKEPSQQSALFQEAFLTSIAKKKGAPLYLSANEELTPEEERALLEESGLPSDLGVRGGVLYLLRV